MRKIRSIILRDKYLTKDILRVINRVGYTRREKHAPNQIPRYYEFVNNSKIISGYRALERIPEELMKRGSNRPLIVTQKENIEKGVLKTLIRVLDNNGIDGGNIFLCPGSYSTDLKEQVEYGYSSQSCDSVIAVGGRVSFKLARDLCNQALSDNPPEKSSISYIAVPIANAGLDISGCPDIVVLDPRVSKELPAKAAVLYSINALCHAVETYTNPMKNPLSDAYAFSSLCIIRDNLHKAIKFGKDKRVRLALANASLLSSIALMNYKPSLTHVLADILEENYGVSHEEAISIILPHYLDQSILEHDEYYGELLLPLAGPEIYADTLPFERGRKFVLIVRNMIADYHRIHGFPDCLSKIGVKRPDFDKIIEQVLIRRDAKGSEDNIEEDLRNILNFAF